MIKAENIQREQLDEEERIHDERFQKNIGTEKFKGEFNIEGYWNMDEKQTISLLPPAGILSHKKRNRILFAR
jgi:hypothetical protein